MHRPRYRGHMFGLEWVLAMVLSWAIPVVALAFLVYWVVRKAVRDGIRDAAEDRRPTAPSTTD